MSQSRWERLIQGIQNGYMRRGVFRPDSEMRYFEAGVEAVLGRSARPHYKEKPVMRGGGKEVGDVVQV